MVSPGMEQALEAFIASNTFAEAIILATKASIEQTGEMYSVELFDNGTWKLHCLTPDEPGDQFTGKVLDLSCLASEED